MGVIKVLTGFSLATLVDALAEPCFKCAAKVFRQALTLSVQNAEGFGQALTLYVQNVCVSGKALMFSVQKH